MKLVKIGNRYINPDKISVVYRRTLFCGNRSVGEHTVVIVGGTKDEYASTTEDIESVVARIEKAVRVMAREINSIEET